MSLEGTIVNGQVQLDQPADLPDGTRVKLLSLAEFEDEFGGVPPATETYSEHLNILRQSIAAGRAGVGGITLEELSSELQKEFGPFTPHSE